jgi:hypothetical protein
MHAGGGILLKPSRSWRCELPLESLSSFPILGADILISSQIASGPSVACVWKPWIYISTAEILGLHLQLPTPRNRINPDKKMIMELLQALARNVHQPLMASTLKFDTSRLRRLSRRTIKVYERIVDLGLQ